jgi:putative inorganic carbon (HCO3(-)) transporter
MNSVWQQLTLENFSLYRWQDASFFYRLLGDPLRAWRQGSFALQWGDAIAGLLVSLVFALAPFVSNDLVGVLLIACACFWLLLTLSDEPTNTGVTPIQLLVLLYWSIATVATALSPVKKAAFTGLSKLTLYLLLFALMARVLRSPRIRSCLIALYLHISLIVSVYGMRQWFFGAERWQPGQIRNLPWLKRRGFTAIWATPICWLAIWCRRLLSVLRLFLLGATGVRRLWR